MLSKKMDNPNGFHQHYNITKENGDPVDSNAIYFVLRLDRNCKDKNHLMACRAAIKQYALTVLGDVHSKHLYQLGFELLQYTK